MTLSASERNLLRAANLPQEGSKPAARRPQSTVSATTARWQGRTAMRISVSCWATTDDDVERSLEAMRRPVAEVAVA